MRTAMSSISALTSDTGKYAINSQVSDNSCLRGRIARKRRHEINLNNIGHSINLDAVIRRNDGQARQSKQASERLAPHAQQQIIAFINTLVLFPPDDTAST